MIRFVKGDILDAAVEAVVNPVNCVGVMGAGLAQQFRSRYRKNYLAYRSACKRKEVRVGKMFVFDNGNEDGPRYVVNFPTKVHWKDTSSLEYIHLGLKALKAALIDRHIQSVALPRLGCGCGKLPWETVRGMILRQFSDLTNVEILVYG